MSKKIFTLLLLAVFMLAQFSMASAAVVDGDVTITALPTFSAATDTLDLEWSVTSMPAAVTQLVCAYYREQADPATGWLVPAPVLSAVVTGLTSANGTLSFDMSLYAFGGQDVVEFYIQVEDSGCGGAETPTDDTNAMTSTFVDDQDPEGFAVNPPKIDGVYTNFLGDDNVSCNTFEMWSLASDSIMPIFTNGPGAGYSGLDAWNQSVTGTFAAPAPQGPADELLSWVYTIPSTATGDWTFSTRLTDFAGNTQGTFNFRELLQVETDEKEDCAGFTDTSGHADETYIRYLADLELIAGNPDGSYGPDNTLTRAEAAVLFEKANGVTDADPGFGTPPAAGSACDFSDVSAADWFAGWVWAACDDGFMNGVGGGLFDPSNLLTRGQIVTIMNNIVNMDISNGGYLDGESECGANQYCTVLNLRWGYYPNSPIGKELREAAWTDVAIGAYYAIPVMHAYGVGVAEGTSATTFSPDQPVLRGEFAKMLYRALGRATDLD